jgi:hypothetical protein
MSPVPTSRTEILRWRAQLLEFRQPWPEWERLDSVANSDVFSVETDPDVPSETRFLAGPKIDGRNRLSHSVLTTDQEKQFRQLVAANPVCPAYLLPLLDIKYADSLMIAGGIGDSICPWSTDAAIQLPNAVGPTSYDASPSEFGHIRPLEITWPPVATYPYQANPFGRIFYVDTCGRVAAFSKQKRAFVQLGSLNNFARYCLAAVLDFKDWYKNYAQQVNLETYQLDFVGDVGTTNYAAFRGLRVWLAAALRASCVWGILLSGLFALGNRWLTRSF